LTLLVLFKTQQLDPQSGGSSVIVPPERPRHPFMSWSVEILLNVAYPPQIQQRTLGQEQPGHPDPRLTSPGVQGPNVAYPPQIQQRIVGQEIPGHPLPLSVTGVQGPNVAPPPQIQQRVVGQEQPPKLPDPQLTTGVQGPNVAPPPQIQQRIVGQEQPPQPISTLAAGAQGVPPVTPEERATVVTQEQPTHPLPRTWDGDQRHPNVAYPPQIQQRSLVTQEQPFHPGPVSWPGTPPTPSINQPEWRIALLGQEQPGHPLPAVRVGVSGPNVAYPPQIQQRINAQEPPWHPGPLTSAGTPPTSLIERRDIRVTQEPPWHPSPLTSPGVSSSSVIERRDVRVTQEQPGHPQLFVGLIAQSAVTVAPVSKIIVGQEQPPALPVPQFRDRALGVVASGIGRIIGVQEIPGHPLPSWWPGTPPIFVPPNFLAPVRRDVTVRQELPWHTVAFIGPNLMFVPPPLPPVPDIDIIRAKRLLASPGRRRVLSPPPGSVGRRRILSAPHGLR
jgi:hypothetical protein